MIRLKVRQIAEAKRLTMAKLSRLADVNYNTVRAIWDDENRDVAVTTLEKLARALKVPVSDLYEILPDDDTTE
jgi:DNA-binding Xre family transcriptional regulator